MTGAHRENPGELRALPGLPALAGLLALLVAAPGWAEPDRATPGLHRSIELQVPPEFAAAPELAAGAAGIVSTETHLGGLRFSGTVEARTRPASGDDGPASVYITTLVSRDKVAYPDAAIHSEFELLRTSPERGSISPDEIERVGWNTKLVTGGAVAELHWRHRGYETETHARALAYRAESGLLHYTQVECIHGTGQAALASLCRTILASATIPADTRATRPALLDPAAVATIPDADPTVPDPTAPTAPGPTAPATPDPADVTGDHAPAPAVPHLSLRDPGELGDQPMPVIPVSKSEKRDYRKLLYLLGGLLLVIGFYFSTRSRSAVPDEPDAGPEDAGPEDAEPEGAGPEDAEPEDAEPEDAAKEQP